MTANDSSTGGYLAPSATLYDADDALADLLAENEQHEVM